MHEPPAEYADVLLPVPVSRLFTYKLPDHLRSRTCVGQRVIVPFGKRKILTGIVFALHNQAPPFETRFIHDLLDEEPCMLPSQLHLLEWMASYYMCTPGEVLQAALPAAFRLSSESSVQIHPAFSRDETRFDFTPQEEKLLTILQQGPLPYNRVARETGTSHPYALIKSLLRKEAVVLVEKVQMRYKPRTLRMLRLHENYLHAEQLEAVFSELAAKPRQEEALLKFLHYVPVLNDASRNKKGVRKSKLLEEGISPSAINTLIKKGILEEFLTAVPRLSAYDGLPEGLPQLSDEQTRCLTEIMQALQEKKVALLHGITGSGKTEIYIHLIHRALQSGSQVLYMLPEIALTTQMVNRLRKVFGNRMAVYHSRFTDNERAEIWNDVLRDKTPFVLGVRSAVFLPFSHLGLIIVDEEHDTSYKQQEPSPRYHARDTALMIGRMHHVPVLLGSATPSLESYFLARQGTFGYITLFNRYGEARLPELVVVNLAQERKARRMKGMFSFTLLEAIAEALDRKEQVIIFQNRRGYAPFITCEDCGYVPRCEHCAVSLTYHQQQNHLMCHYCGYRESVPAECPECSSGRMRTMGYGTEKLEEELRLHFPEARIDRMDLDTTRTRKSHEKLLQNFESGNTDILVGTQMVTKGLDFEHVSLVGVFYADRLLHFPDFRAYERAYQLLTQVSGRAGRKERPGKVIIQTSRPEHLILKCLAHTGPEYFYRQELEDRKLYAYPPFTRLIELTVKHTDKEVTGEGAMRLAQMLRQRLTGVKIVGPGEPMVARIKNNYLMTLLVKIPRNSGNLEAIKTTIRESLMELLQEKTFRQLRIVVDVDPV
jgi:primosomal protein N' (replication factor Y)